MDTQKSTERISEKLRKLADLFDKNPALEQFPELYSRHDFDYVGKHLTGAETKVLDTFAETFGVAIEHFVLGENSAEPGARYSHVETKIDNVQFRFQCRTEDYEKATGKTVDNGGVQ